MTIDTLKTDKGKWRHATFTELRDAVTCGHTEHLQTDRGIIAFRPFKKYEEEYSGSERVKFDKMITLDFSNGHDHSDDESADFELTGRYGVPTLVEAIRWAYRRLNGTLASTAKPADHYPIMINQGQRDAYVLAVIDSEAILEYEMPAGSSALRIVTMIGRQIVGDHRTVSYSQVPKKWITAIRETGLTDWVGMCQRSGYVPFPK